MSTSLSGREASGTKNDQADRQPGQEHLEKNSSLDIPIFVFSSVVYHPLDFALLSPPDHS